MTAELINFVHEFPLTQAADWTRYPTSAVPKFSRFTTPMVTQQFFTAPHKPKQMANTYLILEFSILCIFYVSVNLFNYINQIYISTNVCTNYKLCIWMV